MFDESNKNALPESGSVIIVGATPIGGESQYFTYDTGIPSGEIVQDTTSKMNVRLEPEYIKTLTETVERSKGLGADISFRVGFKDWGYIEFVKKPRSEVKTIQEIIWRKPSK